MAAVNHLEKREVARVTFRVTSEDLEALDWYLASTAGVGS